MCASVKSGLTLCFLPATACTCNKPRCHTLETLMQSGHTCNVKNICMKGDVTCSDVHMGHLRRTELLGYCAQYLHTSGSVYMTCTDYGLARLASGHAHAQCDEVDMCRTNLDGRG